MILGLEKNSISDLLFSLLYYPHACAVDTFQDVVHRRNDGEGSIECVLMFLLYYTTGSDMKT